MRPTAAARSRTAVIGCLLLLVLGACSFPGSGPDADAALDRLAVALSEGSVEGVAFTDGPAAATAYAEITKGLGPGAGDAEVSAQSVSTEGDSATGTLSWRRQVGREQWAYRTEVVMTKVDAADGPQWQVRWSPQILEPSLEPGEQLVETSIKPERGAILGAGDRPIVTMRPVLRVGLDKMGLSQQVAARSAAALARLVEVDAGSLGKQVEATGPKAFVQAIVYRRAEAPDRVLAGLSSIEGARAIADDLPLAPTKDFASAILGTVGAATAELVKDSDGRIRPGDEVGLSGLQKRYDEELFGTRGATVVAVDDEGERRTLFTAEPVPGTPLRTTIEIPAQQVAQRVLAGIPSASALVAIRPSTGDLVAVASGPGSEGYNSATYGRYPPGSTFKVVSALALLRAGVTPRTSVACPRTTVVDGKTFKNYDDYPASGIGRISFADALANSCNTAFITQRDELAEESLEQAAAALGFGVDHDLGFPAFFGTVDPPASETQAAANLIGQGTVLASPMAMATVVASVLHGSAVLPRLLPGNEVDQKAPAEPLTASEAATLRTLMRGVVERGSGRVLGDLGGGPVLAKTGTAEFGDQPPLPTHAWMVAGRGDLAVAVFVERGESGSGTAGPVLHRFLETVR